jgi:hypothetical protein
VSLSTFFAFLRFSPVNRRPWIFRILFFLFCSFVSQSTSVRSPGLSDPLRRADQLSSSPTVVVFFLVFRQVQYEQENLILLLTVRFHLEHFSVFDLFRGRHRRSPASLSLSLLSHK